ncbi:hypothetical protein VEE63_22420 [Escherichia coli]|nr:hypothetical protein VEE63_22420 [Escherichia coli]
MRFTLPGGTAIPEMIDIDHISAFKLLTFLFHPMKSFIFKMRPDPHFNNPWLENIAQWPTSKSDKKRQLRFI